jgi:hypothetical protein
MTASARPIRLFAPDAVIVHGERVLDAIVDAYHAPILDGRTISAKTVDGPDLLKAFSEECRGDLEAVSDCLERTLIGNRPLRREVTNPVAEQASWHQ